MLALSVMLCGTLAAGPEAEAAAEPDELKFKWLTQFFWAQDTELNDKIFDMVEDYMVDEPEHRMELPEEFDGPTYFASGDYADIFGHWDANAVNQLGEDGLLVNLLEHDLPFYGPIIEQGYNRLKLQAGDGGIYNFSFGFDTHAAQAGSTQWVWVWRHDIFKKHGIAIPETLEETYHAAKQLKELYPDSYPDGLLRGSLVVFGGQVIFMINRTSQALYYNGSEFVLGPIHDEDRYRASLEYLNRFYEEGLLDPEFFTQTGDQSKEKTVNGTYFFVPNHFAGNILRFNTMRSIPAWNGAGECARRASTAAAGGFRSPTSRERNCGCTATWSATSTASRPAGQAVRLLLLGGDDQPGDLGHRGQHPRGGRRRQPRAAALVRGPVPGR